jgi:SAM-dependent methyltransferase
MPISILLGYHLGQTLNPDQQEAARDVVQVCPLCAGGAGYSFCIKDYNSGTPGTFTVARCPSCHVYWLRNPFPPARIHEAYPETSYYSINEDTQTPGGWRERALAARYKRRFTPLRLLGGIFQAFPMGDTPGRVLDVGSGTGQRLQRLLSAGWTGAGVEPSAAAVRVAQESGLDVRQGTAEALPFDDNSFDAVIMAHSLEHCYRPSTAASEAFRVLRPSGELIVTTPNTRSLARLCFGRFWLHWDAPRHLVIFDRRSLVRLLVGVGFQPIRVRGTASGGGWVGSLLNARGSPRLPLAEEGRGMKLLRLCAGVACVVTNWLPWSDEVEVISLKRSAESSQNNSKAAEG